MLILQALPLRIIWRKCSFNFGELCFTPWRTCTSSCKKLLFYSHVKVHYECTNFTMNELCLWMIAMFRVVVNVKVHDMNIQIYKGHGTVSLLDCNVLSQYALSSFTNPCLTPYILSSCTLSYVLSSKTWFLALKFIWFGKCQ